MLREAPISMRSSHPLGRSPKRASTREGTAQTGLVARTVGVGVEVASATRARIKPRALT